MVIFIKMDVKVMKLETGQLLFEGVRNSFHSCCFDSDLDNTAPSKQSELQLSSSWWWFHSFFMGEIIWTWIWSLLTFFEQQYVKVKKLMKKGNCVLAHLIFFTSWSSLGFSCSRFVQSKAYTLCCCPMYRCVHIVEGLCTPCRHIVDTPWRAQRGSFCSVSLTFDDD